MEAIMQPVEMNQALKFEERDFGTLRRYTTENVLPLIENLKDEYQLLGLSVPFNDRLLIELLTEGTDKTRSRVEAMIRKDLQGKSKIVIDNHLEKVDEFVEPLETSLEQLKQGIKLTNNICNYKLLPTDFVISDNSISFNEKELKEKFTYRISNDAQLQVYNQALKICKEYNEMIDLFEKLGKSVPFTGLLGSHSLLSKIADGYSRNSDRIEVNINAIKAFE
jgi:hypothetical protein